MRLPLEMYRITGCAMPRLGAGAMPIGAGFLRALRFWRAAWRQHRKAWRRRRQRALVYRELQELDARTLRDLGIDRNEIMSVVTELAGDADPTRTHPLQVLRGLY